MRRFNRVVLLVVVIVGAAIVIAYGGLSATLSRVATSMLKLVSWMSSTTSAINSSIFH